MFIHEGAAARRRTVREKKGGGGNKRAEQRRESLILLPLVLVHACRCVFACVREQAGREAEKVCRCTQMCHSSEKSLSNGGQEDYGSAKTYTTFTHSQIFLFFFSPPVAQQTLRRAFFLGAFIQGRKEIRLLFSSVLI